MMADASEIRPHMEVVGSDGVPVGTVDHMDGGDQIKLARRDQADGRHHFIPLSMVARVDGKVHLSVAGAAALAIASRTLGGELPLADDPIPPIRNRQVEGAPPRRNFLLPWIVGVVGVILLLLLLRGCFGRSAEVAGPPPVPVPSTGTALPVEAVTLPGGAQVSLAPGSLNYSLQQFLASAEPAPRTFQFDKLNFDTGSAAIRPEDMANVDALSQILAAYPHAVVTITGYTDTQGTAPANAQLGQERADAVTAALVARGIDKSRLTARTGGEANPTDNNATPQGRFDNRRSELTVTAK
jgi:outer membrane protein OmpA-like peptidoglycan-associated protein